MVANLLLPRTEQAALLHRVEHGIQGSGAQLRAVRLQFFDDPQSKDWRPGGVLEHVQPDQRQTQAPLYTVFGGKSVDRKIYDYRLRLLLTIFDYNEGAVRVSSMGDKRPSDLRGSPLVREVLLNFWKIHILHHAAEGTVYGQWMMGELRRHGYDISPGTLYPLLRRMERHGWIEPLHASTANIHSRKEYRLTKLGTEALDLMRTQLKELCREVLEEKDGGFGRSKGGAATG
jgi:DNA-binding PadR family transcriptional regulator